MPSLFLDCGAVELRDQDALTAVSNDLAADDLGLVGHQLEPAAIGANTPQTALRSGAGVEPTERGFATPHRFEHLLWFKPEPA